MSFRAGYVALLGKPNVGKSTLLNHIVGQKVSIVSNKPQTTRRRVIGISTKPDHQIAFIDTPGIHSPSSQLGKSMIEQARSSLDTADVILFVGDGAHHPGEGDKEVARLLERDVMGRDIPRILCLNKMDLLKAEDVERNVEAFTKMIGTDRYMMTTASRGHNVDKLVEMIVEQLPERAPMYDEDEYTDQSQRFMTAELVRERILQLTRQEIPHASAVIVDDWEQDGELTRIMATILVEKESQRGILIGKGGTFLREIGTKAREEIEPLVGHKVFLQLHVKVSKDWRMSPRMLQELEYGS